MLLLLWKGGGKAVFNRNEEISNGERFLDDDVWGERIIFMFWDLGAVEFEWVSWLVVMGVRLRGLWESSAFGVFFRCNLL